MKTLAFITLFIGGVFLLGCKENAPTAQNSQTPPPPGPGTVVLRTGTFSGQNSYTCVGMVNILRDTTSGTETVRTTQDFRVSGGAGTITVWLTNAAGAVNLNSTTTKVQLGAITSGFAGVYSFAVPGNNSSSYTRVVAFCQAAQINFGQALLGPP
jgi:hypothetical protein